MLRPVERRLRFGETASRRRVSAAPDARRGGARAVSVVVSERGLCSRLLSLCAPHRRRRRARHGARARSLSRLPTADSALSRGAFESSMNSVRHDLTKEQEKGAGGCPRRSSRAEPSEEL